MIETYDLESSSEISVENETHKANSTTTECHQPLETDTFAAERRNRTNTRAQISEEVKAVIVQNPLQGYGNKMISEMFKLSELPSLKF